MSPSAKKKSTRKTRASRTRRILLFGGGAVPGLHEFTKVAPVLRKHLDANPRLRVDVVHDDLDAFLPERLAPYNAIVVYYTGEPPTTNFIQHVAIYDVEIENIAAPVPHIPELPSKDQFEILNDTGSDVFDDVTLRTEPEFIIEADLNEFALEGITILTAAEAEALDVPGAAVEVFVNGNSVGFADPIPDTGNTKFRYTFEPGELPQELFHADSGGWMHNVKAAVRIIDGQMDPTGAPDPNTGQRRSGKYAVFQKALCIVEEGTAAESCCGRAEDCSWGLLFRMRSSLSSPASVMIFFNVLGNLRGHFASRCLEIR